MTNDPQIKVFNTKEQFVPAEFSLLDLWMPFLERKKKGTINVYLYLQRGINREESNGRYGKTWPRISKIATKCNLSAPIVYKILDILTEYNFIRVHSGKATGKSNTYDILNLPEFDQEIEVKDYSVKEDEDSEVFEKGTEKLKEVYLKKATDTLNKLAEKVKWNTHDVVKFYSAYYVIVFNFKPESVTKKELRFVKLMVEEHGLQETIEVIKYVLSNWEMIDYIKNKNYPSLHVIYAYRRTIFPESKLGEIRKAGQHKDTGKVGVTW
jgi:hypothetical protein